MHDPDVVAWSIRTPFPQLSRMSERRRVRGVQLSWPFLRVGRHELYFPSAITVWHHEPGGADALTVCKSRWQWHFRHLRVQVHLVGRLRRRFLTRCTWCGGRSTRRDPVNVSHSWHGARAAWYRGEPGLYHAACSSIETAHRTCICSLTEGSWDHTDYAGRPYGHCAACNGYRRADIAGRDLNSPHIEATALLRSIPTGHRNPTITTEVEALWATHRKTTALAEGNQS
ncbi:hypothetical protein ACLBWP_03420 [Microbacterium sp. M1A1_1b]